MTQEKFLFNEIKLVFQKIIKRKINIKNKIYDFKEWDSLANFNILLLCEKKFKLKFTTQEFSKLNSVKEIYNLVKKRSKKKA